MKLSHRIFLGYFLVVAIAGIFLLISVKDELRPAMRQSMEETLVDTSQLLAELVEQELRYNQVDEGNFAYAIRDYLHRTPNAAIWGVIKNRTTFHIYITDEAGIVLYDSNNGSAVGKDYSQWNDVYLTLQGKYGARSSRTSPNDPHSSTMYVAAPVQHDGKIIGVLSVGKPTLSIIPFIEFSQRNIAQAGLILLSVALGLGWLFAHYVGRSTRKLATYAAYVAEGKKAQLPNIADQELAQLAQAMESMRTALEGKEYVERYIHTLTHEIKSPLSGIKGASELLSEEMPLEDRKRFIDNINDGTGRIQIIIDRLLELAKLEKQQALEAIDPIDLKVITHDIITSHTAQLQHKSLHTEIKISDSTGLQGDAFLIRQAITNLIDNAIDFSPNDSCITITGERVAQHYTLTISDQGSGIPNYAKDKIFDRFYSLPRPDTNKKSSGLGLPFVKEVMALHQGDVSVESNDSGFSISVTFPLT